MWSKLGKRLIDLWQQKKETPQTQLSPEEETQKVMKVAMREIELAIQKHQATLQQTTANQKELAQQLHHHRKNAETLQQKAMQAIKNRSDAQAQDFLNQKATEEQQAAQYQTLYENITKVVLQLEQQLGKMKWQLQELKSREVLMTARMQNAKTQKEITEYLQDLDMVVHESFDQELLRTEMEADILNGISESDKVLANTQGEFLLKQEMEKLDRELKEAEEKEKQRKEANQQKRLEQAFGQTIEQDRQQQEEERRKREADRRKMIEQFAINSPQEGAKEQQKVNLQQFFEETDKNITQQDKVIEDVDTKKSLLNSFFTEEKSPTAPEENKSVDSKQKLLDDFFKD
jgi:phage shock protein A